jgi:ABC-type antimicrobial peptide transport system permease subunit
VVVDPARTGIPSFFGRTYSAPLGLMQGLVGIVLFLCCVNVSGLMMSKLHEREHEFAVRTALGAGRLRLVRQYLAESFVIALAGAALGAVIAWHGTGLLLPFFRHPNMGYGLAVRTAEIGIRAALGASRGDILRMVLADALRLVAAGVAAGALGLLFAAGPIRHMLYGVSPFDLATVGTTAALIALVVISASFWPARRAASVDPMQAMRRE